MDIALTTTYELDTIDDLDCSNVYRYNARDLCNGNFCNYDRNCASACCWGTIRRACSDKCSASSLDDLVWLWWTLAFVLIFYCICSIGVAARKRRRLIMAEAVHSTINSADSHGYNEIVVASEQ